MVEPVADRGRRAAERTARSAVKANQSIERGIGLLWHVAQDPQGMTIAALARAAGMSRTTTHRLLTTLERFGLVDRLNEDGRYVLGYELVRLGRAADPQQSIVARATPVLQRLSATCEETATLSVPNGRGGVDIVAQVEGPHAIGLTKNWVGVEFPLHATSGGKLLLAELSDDELGRWLAAPLPRFASRTIVSPGELEREIRRVRRQGYSVIEDELEEGLCSISKPVRDDGQLVGMLSVLGPTYRLASRRDGLIEELTVAAGELEASLSRGPLTSG